METKRFGILISLFLLLAFDCVSNESTPKNFEGIWVNEYPSGDITDYLAIANLGSGNYYVINISESSQNELDYASYGFINEEGYLEVSLKEVFFLIEKGYGFVDQYWNGLKDPHPERFKRVGDNGKAEKDSRRGHISDEALHEFILSEVESREDE